MQEGRKGITIITGFLGAGKTSLLNQIIKKETQYKFAIIENEFGEFGLDAEIIEGVERDNIFELSNGCICCTMNTELQETLLQLLNSSFEFDYLLIETTGIAEPDSIVQSVVANQLLKEQFYIDSLICLADAINFEENSKKPEAIKQIAMADIVLLNKVEGVEDAQLGQTEHFIAELNPLCSILKTIHSDYKNQQLIDSLTFDEKRFVSIFNKKGIGAPRHLSIDIPIKSTTIEIEGDFNHKKFMYWMEYFLMLNQSDIFRAKGIISFKDSSRKQIFQAVKAAFTIEDGNFWQKDEKRQNQLVFIGKEIDKNSIIEGLQSLLSD